MLQAGLDHSVTAESTGPPTVEEQAPQAALEDPAQGSQCIKDPSTRPAGDPTGPSETGMLLRLLPSAPNHAPLGPQGGD